MLGSLEDAEDTLQETLLRAWRRLDSFEGRASLRAWLYKISTNACLDVLAQRKRRGTPLSIFAPADPNAALAAPALEAFWIEPLPDTLADEQLTADPEARYDALESVTFAFLSAIQSLPGRQRAVLLLRDVLGWSAGETAEILDMTVAAVNSALQRARATMKQGRNEPHTRPAARRDDQQMSALLARYVQAWESADSAA